MARHLLSAAMPGARILLERLMIAALLALALGHGWLRLQLVPDLRVDLGGAELNAVYGMQKLLLDRPLYTDPEQPPFEVIQYTPLFHALSAATARAVGVEPLDTVLLFRVGRTVALALNLMTAALVLSLCLRLGARPATALAGACIGFMTFTEHYYGRPDALATLLVVALVHALVRPQRSASWGWQRAAGLAVIGVAAVLAKQTAAVALLMVVADRLLAGDRSGLARFTIAATAIALAATGLILAWWPVPALWRNLVQASRNGIDPTLFMELFDKGIFKYHAGWLLLIAGCAGLVLRRRSGQGATVVAAGALALLSGLLFGLKRGGGLNYLVEAEALAVAMGLAWLPASAGGWGAALRTAVLAYGLLFGVHRTRLLQGRWGGESLHAAHAAAWHADHAVLGAMQAEGLTGTDRVYITYRGHLELLLNGQGQLPQKDIVEWSLTPPFDLGALQALFHEGGIRYVVADRRLESLTLLGKEHPMVHLFEAEGRHVHAVPAH